MLWSQFCWAQIIFLTNQIRASSGGIQQLIPALCSGGWKPPLLEVIFERPLIEVVLQGKEGKKVNGFEKCVSVRCLVLH
jgi:hypothetical protein